VRQVVLYSPAIITRIRPARKYSFGNSVPGWESRNQPISMMPVETTPAITP
jgi:hypothetical protein